MYFMPYILKICIPTTCIFSNVHFGPFVDFFFNYEQKYYIFRVLGCTFRKVQGVNLHITQNSGEYSALIWGKVHTCKNTDNRNAYF